MLDLAQAVTLRAFLTALVELDSPLPATLQQEINEVGEIFATAPNDALNRLLELAENNYLQQSYKEARIKIQTQNEPQELNKYDKPSQQNQPEPIPPEHLANIAIPILKAPDSSGEAKKHKSKIIIP
ncbi:MAG: hypothetical protein DSM106950_21965 [Stigonema ocellatum SAG 48.90 = DSM 106950]|nr:hypothetical protein [Stigonema ocellatum SAG 48.90 = DSM 106950]